jgi:hypothetical protein
VVVGRKVGGKALTRAAQVEQRPLACSSLSRPPVGANGSFTPNVGLNWPMPTDIHHFIGVYHRPGPSPSVTKASILRNGNVRIASAEAFVMHPHAGRF